MYAASHACWHYLLLLIDVCVYVRARESKGEHASGVS